MYVHMCNETIIVDFGILGQDCLIFLSLGGPLHPKNYFIFGIIIHVGPSYMTKHNKLIVVIFRSAAIYGFVSSLPQIGGFEK